MNISFDNISIFCMSIEFMEGLVFLILSHSEKGMRTNFLTEVMVFYNVG